MLGEMNGSVLMPLKMTSAIVEFGQDTPGWRHARLPEVDFERPHSFRTLVRFEVSFANVPLVHVGLIGFDMDNRDSARRSLSTGEISATGFELLVVTWLNTLVYNVEIARLAVGHQATH